MTGLDRQSSAEADIQVPLTLVPVEVFGGDCDCHERHDDPNCHGWSYGLCDAVQSWSDCNRATGRIYRVDETWSNRDPGESVTVHVDAAQRGFFDHTWGQIEQGVDGAVQRRSDTDATEIERLRARVAELETHELDPRGTFPAEQQPIISPPAVRAAADRFAPPTR